MSLAVDLSVRHVNTLMFFNDGYYSRVIHLMEMSITVILI